MEACGALLCNSDFTQPETTGRFHPSRSHCDLRGISFIPESRTTVCVQGLCTFETEYLEWHRFHRKSNKLLCFTPVFYFLVCNLSWAFLSVPYVGIFIVCMYMQVNIL